MKKRNELAKKSNITCSHSKGLSFTIFVCLLFVCCLLVCHFDYHMRGIQTY